jgi:hypothetical protein
MVQQRCWPVHALCRVPCVVLCCALSVVVRVKACCATISQHARNCQAQVGPLGLVCETRPPPASLSCRAMQRLWRASRGGLAAKGLGPKLRICKWQLSVESAQLAWLPDSLYTAAIIVLPAASHALHTLRHEAPACACSSVTVPFSFSTDAQAISV